MNLISSELKAKTKARTMDILEKLIAQFENLIVRFSLIDNSAFFDNQQIDWVTDLEANWMRIRQELDEVLKYRDALPNIQDISAQQYLITQDNRWKAFFLYAYGIKASKNCEICPETTRIIENIPGMKTAFFSFLLPHKHLPEHRGPYKGVVRCHLGLIIPKPKEDCKIRVGNDVRYWDEGKSLIFDDSFQHEAWNNTDSMRVVLILDFVRPLRFPFSVINHFIIKLIAWSPFVQDAKVNQKKWDKILENLQNKLKTS